MSHAADPEESVPLVQLRRARPHYLAQTFVESWRVEAGNLLVLLAWLLFSMLDRKLSVIMLRADRES